MAPPYCTVLAKPQAAQLLRVFVGLAFVVLLDRRAVRPEIGTTRSRHSHAGRNDAMLPQPEPLVQAIHTAFDCAKAWSVNLHAAVTRHLCGLHGHDLML